MRLEIPFVLRPQGLGVTGWLAPEFRAEPPLTQMSHEELRAFNRRLEREREARVAEELERRRSWLQAENFRLALADARQEPPPDLSSCQWRIRSAPKPAPSPRRHGIPWWAG